MALDFVENFIYFLFILSFVYFSRRMTIAPTCDCAFWLTKFCRNWTVRGVL